MAHVTLSDNFHQPLITADAFAIDTDGQLSLIDGRDGTPRPLHRWLENGRWQGEGISDEVSLRLRLHASHGLIAAQYDGETVLVESDTDGFHLHSFLPPFGPDQGDWQLYLEDSSRRPLSRLNPNSKIWVPASEVREVPSAARIVIAAEGYFDAVPAPLGRGIRSRPSPLTLGLLCGRVRRQRLLSS